MARVALLVLLAVATPVSACSMHAPHTPQPLARSCYVRGPLPDPRCTPGAVDPRVTEPGIERTICARGYARRVRPPRRYTAGLKSEQISAYRFYAGRSMRGYEEDHLVPLELGGAPRNVRNLWPERVGGPAGSAAKDAEEDLLHRRVCADEEPLRTAQREMATNWYAAYVRDRASR